MTPTTMVLYMFLNH